MIARTGAAHHRYSAPGHPGVTRRTCQHLGIVLHIVRQHARAHALIYALSYPGAAFPSQAVPGGVFVYVDALRKEAEPSHVHGIDKIIYLPETGLFNAVPVCPGIRYAPIFLYGLHSVLFQGYQIGMAAAEHGFALPFVCGHLYVHIQRRHVSPDGYPYLLVQQESRCLLLVTAAYVPEHLKTGFPVPAYGTEGCGQAYPPALGIGYAHTRAVLKHIAGDVHLHLPYFASGHAHGPRGGQAYRSRLRTSQRRHDLLL